MPQDSRLVFKGSPFLPQFDSAALVAGIVADISSIFEPAPAIALGITPILATHAIFLRLEEETLARYQVTESNLTSLSLGYQHPLWTIMASAICKQVSSREDRLTLFEELLAATHNFDVLRLQEKMTEYLNATCNLLLIDPSGAQIFQYLVDYPFSRDEFFLSGIEIASRIYFGIALEVVKVTGNDSWLNLPYDPTVT